MLIRMLSIDTTMMSYISQIASHTETQLLLCIATLVVSVLLLKLLRPWELIQRKLADVKAMRMLGSEDGAKNNFHFLPDKLDCHECENARDPAELWWCRDCAKTLCGACNLLKSHTEHRSGPFNRADVLRTAALALDYRCSRRSRHAGESESELKQFLAKVQMQLILKIQRKLVKENESDRRKATEINQLLGSEGLQSRPPAGGPPAFSKVLLDSDVERLLHEASKVAPASSRKVLEESPQAEATPIVLSSKRTFAVFPDDISAEDFMEILDDCLRSRSGSVRHSRSRGNSVDYPFSNDHMHLDLSDSTFPRSHHNISSSTPVDEERRYDRFSFPLEPRINVNNNVDTSLQLRLAKLRDCGDEPKRRSLHTLPREKSYSPSPDPRANNSAVENSVAARNYDAVNNNGSRRSSLPYLSKDGVDSRASSNGKPESIFQDNLSQGQSGVESPKPKGDALHDSKLTPPRNGSFEDYGLTPTPADEADKGGRKSRTGGGNTTRLSLVTFYFGDDFLTRPIDVAYIIDGLWAVSDSCGGVYIVNNNGDIKKKIPIEGASASSIAYCSDNWLLYVSLLRKSGRSIAVINAEKDFELIREIPCPTDPEIDTTRARWLALTRTGELYVASGDNTVSAIWKLEEKDSWRMVKQEKNTRYQYLQVTEENAPENYVVLMTTDGISSSILLFVVGKLGEQVWSEYNLSKTYHLNDYIRSPASAVADAHGNVLILDYRDGKLWMLRQVAGEQRTRAIRTLTEIGPQSVLGMDVSPDGWVYVATLGRKRIHAIHYEDEAFGIPTPESLRRLSRPSSGRNSPASPRQRLTAANAGSTQV